MTFNQLRQNLNTLCRHGVLTKQDVVEAVAERLCDPESIKRSRTLPYQLLATYRATLNVPPRISSALAHAVETAVSNVPDTTGTIGLCPDASGSMPSPLTGRRGSATSSIRCVDVAALVAAAFLRKSEHAIVLPFSTEVVPFPRPLHALDSVVTN